MIAAIIVFPGSNCDRDLGYVFSRVLQHPYAMVWHEEKNIPKNTQCIIIPGGFSYGDYLRAGAIANHSPIMSAIKKFAADGGKILGICNGFQILCEANLLPGTLVKNSRGRFVCQTQKLIWQKSLAEKITIKLPVAHGEGRYFADKSTLAMLEDEGKIALRYCEKNPDGSASINGSLNGVAGIIGGKENNILGMMPHPERMAEERLGGSDGVMIFKNLINSSLRSVM